MASLRRTWDMRTLASSSLADKIQEASRDTPVELRQKTHFNPNCPGYISIPSFRLLRCHRIDETLDKGSLL